MSRFSHHHPEDPQGAWDSLVDRADHARKEARESGTPTRLHYTGLLACTIARLLNVEAPPLAFEGADAHQHQQNGAYGAHQLAVYMVSPDGEPGQLYRVIIAPADAPITIGGIPADQHFANPLGAAE